MIGYIHMLFPHEKWMRSIDTPAMPRVVKAAPKCIGLHSRSWDWHPPAQAVDEIMSSLREEATSSARPHRLVIAVNPTPPTRESGGGQFPGQ